MRQIGEAAIWDIANLCAFYGGPGVLDARDFLLADSIDLWDFDWEDSCIVPSPKRGYEEQANSLSPVNSKLSYLLYPNPTANHQFYIDWNRDEKGEATVYSLLGEKVATTVLISGKSTIALTNINTNTGTYIIILTENGSFIGSEKLVLIK